MSPEAFQAALYNPQGSHAADHVFTREEADALRGPRARAALRALWIHRTVNGIKTVGPRDYALVRSVRRRGDANEICAAVRECLDASEPQKRNG